MIGVMIVDDKAIEMTEVRSFLTKDSVSMFDFLMMLSESKLIAITCFPLTGDAAFKIIGKYEPYFDELVERAMASSLRKNLRCLIYDDDGKLLYDIDDKCIALT